MSEHGHPVSLIVKIGRAHEAGDAFPEDDDTSQDDVVLSSNDKVTIEEKGKNGESFDVDFVFDQDQDEQDIVFKGLLNQVKGFTEGYSVTLVIIGSSQSRKSETVEGLIPAFLHTVFERLQQKYPDGGRGRNKPSYNISFSSFEILDEKIRDLLNNKNQDLELTHDLNSEFIIERCSCRDNLVYEEDVVEALNFSFASRKNTNKMIEFGDSRRYAHTGWIFDLNQNIPNANRSVDSLKSRMLVLEVAGTEKLMEDQSALRTREGPTLNKSLLGLRNVAFSLSNASTADDQFAPFETSKLTKILKNSLCRNSLTVFVSVLRQGEAEKSLATMELGVFFYGLPTFPVKQDDRLQGLLRSYRSEILRFEQELLSKSQNGGNKSSGNDSNYLLKVNELEGRIVRDNLEKLKVIEEKERVYEKLVEFKEKFNEVVTQKAKVQQTLLEAEEEKLKISKALLDLKIENNQVIDEAESVKYELTTKLLNAENEIMQLELKQENNEKGVASLNKEVTEKRELAQNIENDMRILRNNFKKVDGLYKSELRKNEELGVELLSLVNQKDALLKETTTLRKQNESLANEAATLSEKHATLLESKKQLEEALRSESVKNDTLNNEKMKVELELKRVCVQFENQKTELEKSMLDYRRERDAELSSIKTTKKNEILRASKSRDNLVSQLEEIKISMRKSDRKIVELESNLAEKTMELVNVNKENASLAEQVNTAREKFREKLINLMKESKGEDELDAESVEKEKIQSELYNSMRSSEKELIGKVEAMRKVNYQLVSKNRALLDRYRNVKNDLEDMDPEAAGKYKDDEDIYKAQTSDSETRLEREISALQKKLETARADIVEAQEKNISLIEENRRTMKEQMSRNNELEAELKMLEKQKMNLEDENAALSQRSGADRSDRSAKQFQEFQQNLIDQIEELKNSAAKTATAQQNNAETERLKQENEKLKDEIKDLERKGPSTNSAEVEDLKKEIKRLKKQQKKAGPVSEDSGGGDRPELLTRVTVAEEELKQYKANFKSTMGKYQKQIKELKKERDMWKKKAGA